MMRRKPLALALAALPLLMGSCMKDDPENHQLFMVRQQCVAYADQTLDSLRFMTFDSWRATPLVDWVSVAGDNHGDIRYSPTARYLVTVMLNLRENTTGRTRGAEVRVNSYEYEATGFVTQYGHLDVERPQPFAERSLDAYTPDSVSFTLKDSADTRADSIVFTAHKSWSLALETPADSAWLSLGAAGGPAGHHAVPLAMEPNTGAAEPREARVRLTSGAVSNTILVRQQPAAR